MLLQNATVITKCVVTIISHKSLISNFWKVIDVAIGPRNYHLLLVFIENTYKVTFN